MDEAVTIPPEFLPAGAAYKYEVPQIDASGNQTIAEDEFCAEDGEKDGVVAAQCNGDRASPKP